MDVSEKFWMDYVGGTLAGYALTAGAVTEVRSERKIIEGGLRLRRFYYMPVIAPDVHVDYIKTEVNFYKANSSNLVGQLVSSWVGTDPNNAGEAVFSSFPWMRKDVAVSVWPYGYTGPLAADPNSRPVQWTNLVGYPFCAHGNMLPTEFEMDAEQVEVITQISVKAGGGGAASRHVIFAGVRSGRLLT